MKRLQELFPAPSADGAQRMEALLRRQRQEREKQRMEKISRSMRSLACPRRAPLWPEDYDAPGTHTRES